MSNNAKDRGQSKPPWRRILHEQQPYPDSHLPEEEWVRPVLVGKDGTSRAASYLELSVLLAPLLQRMNVVFVFLAIFWRLEQRILHPAQLTLWCITALFIGFVAWQTTTSKASPQARNARSRNSMAPEKPGEDLLNRQEASVLSPERLARTRSRSAPLVISFIIVMLLLYALSPVLRTLTEATTSDTIYPLSFSLFFLHLCLSDNGRASAAAAAAAPAQRKASANASRDRRTTAEGKPDTLSSRRDAAPLFSALSLNAAASASLVLASRLPSNAHVFVLLLLAILAFAFVPLLTDALEHHFNDSRGIGSLLGKRQLSVPALVAAWAVQLTSSMPSAAPVTFICIANFFVGFVVPLWLRRAEHHKIVYVKSVKGIDVPSQPLWRVAKPVSRSRTE